MHVVLQNLHTRVQSCNNSTTERNESQQLKNHLSSDDLGVDEPMQPKQSFPMTTFGKGKNARHRSFAAEWYRGRPWLEYSRQADAAFCYPCRKFRLIKTSEMNDKCELCFISGGYRNWKSATEQHKGFSKHEQSALHKRSMACWLEKRMRQTANKEISTMINCEQLARNRYYVSSIVDVIHFLVSNELPLRGRFDSAPEINANEDGSDFLTTNLTHSSGLFLKLFEYTLKKDKVLRDAYMTIPVNATYTSHDIQNVIIQLMADVVTKCIVDEVGDAKFTLKVDGTRDPTGRENISIVIRYVSHDAVIKERLLCLATSEKFGASDLADVILNEIQTKGLDINNILSQCYDGAAVMSGRSGGVQRIIQDRLKKTVPYVHCYNHQLHLVVVSVMSSDSRLTEFFELCDCLYKFTKRPNMAVIYQGHRLKRLLDQRWTGHFETVHNILLSFVDLIELLKDAEVNKKGTTDVRVEASGLLRKVNCAEFIFIAKMVSKVLDTFRPVDKSLQNRSVDLLTANRLIGATKEVIITMRSDDHFDELCEETLSVVPFDDANKVCRRRKLNPKYASSVIYETVGYRESSGNQSEDFECEMKRLYFSTIDAVLAEMNERFSHQDQYLAALMAADPCSPDFLNESLLQPLAKLADIELDLAQLSVARAHVQKHLKGASTIDVMKDSVINMGTPAVRSILAAALTFGASSAVCESSFSTLSRILTDYRRSMLQTRKSNLVLLAFENDLASKLTSESMKEYLLRKFNSMSSRRLQLY